MMHRRQFLKVAVAGSLLPSARVWAASSAGRPKFVLVFLRGAYDAANLLIPYRNDFYYESRPHIAVPRPESGRDGAIALDADWALHPALRASLLPLWQRRQLAFVPFTGTHDMTRSHFETQDHIELGQGPQPTDFNDGFLNRLIQQLNGRTPAMAFTSQVPLSLRGPARVPNLALARSSRTLITAQQRRRLEQMWGDTPEAHAVAEGFTVRSEVNHDMATARWAAEMRAASRGAVDPGGFVGVAARVGALMRDSFEIGFIDVGGWDTHVYEATTNGAQGQLATKLGALGEGLAALARAAGPAWKDMTVVVISEFGRTFRENGNRGTDHGHGSVYWMLGGSVRGGRIAGEQVPLSPSTLNQNRDYPVLSDYRAVLGGLFARLWNLNAGRIRAVFPDTQARDLGLV
jgi:uncharacterized protein (DUF1501 family)